MTDDFKGLEIAVLIPCFNEEVTIAHVVRDFRRAQRARRDVIGRAPLRRE